MYYVETFAAGTPFYWKIILDDVSDLEFEAFLTCLHEFSKMPFIGGKSNVGHGEVAIKFDSWVHIDSRVQHAQTSVGMPLGDIYNQHLTTNADAIHELLRGM